MNLLMRRSFSQKLTLFSKIPRANLVGPPIWSCLVKSGCSILLQRPRAAQALRLVQLLLGILITGGSDNQNTNRSASKSTEVFLPHSGKTCSMESIPGPKLFSTLDLVSGTPVLCGGDMTNPSNCLQFLQTSKKGLWISFANLQHTRYEHSSWASPDGLLLFGGSGSDYSTEIVGGGKGFNLNENTL